LYDSYMAFLVACDFKAARVCVSGAVGGGLRDPVRILEILGDDMEELDENSDNELEEPSAEDRGASSAQDSTGQPEMAATDWQAMNRQYRRGGFEFVTRAALGEVMILRTCLEPFRIIMSMHFKLSAEKWEIQQRALDAKVIEGNASVEEPRQFRAVIAATGELEDSFHEMTRSRLFEASHWQHLPTPDRTVNLQHLCFRILSRMGCSIHQLLTLPHSQYPVKMFLLLADSSLAELVTEEPDCLLDDFSRKFCAHFKEKGLDHPDALMALKVAGMMWRLDIADVESRHAALRRLLKRSPQAKRPLQPALSAQWVGR
jgi:hypothetical protein